MPAITVTKATARLVICSVFVVCLISASFNSAFAQTGQKEGGGLIGGAIIGGVLGSLIGGDAAGRVVGSVAGAAIGGFIGSRIGAALDEQDRQALDRATRAAFSSGKTQRFANRRTGVKGMIEVSSSSRNSAGNLCRTVNREVDQNGNVVRESLSACRGARGWEAGA